jgi:uncharacterized protein YecE (DUF72 family)
VPRIHIGCSGWNYRHWRGVFYPEKLPVARWFEFYAQRFDTVEINNTFYRLPEPAVFTAWERQAPAGFVYAVKASRYLTHMKKLREPAEALERLVGRATLLGAHLGPLLYQLPPGWRVDADRLAEFLRALPPGLTHVLEFREPSWYADPVLALLRAHAVGLCVHDMPGSAIARAAIGPAIYVRFHGPTGQYSGSYEAAALQPWAEWIAGAHRDGHDVHVYFNNDIGGHAIGDAERLRTAVARLI